MTRRLMMTMVASVVGLAIAAGSVAAHQNHERKVLGTVTTASAKRLVVKTVIEDLRKIATKCYTCYAIQMSRRITQRELRNDSASVLRDVQAGETITVTRNGTPIAELRPVSARRFVPRAAIASGRARAPRVDFGRLRADLDAVVNPFTDA